MIIWARLIIFLLVVHCTLYIVHSVSAQTSTPTPPPSREERAIYNINQGTSPLNAIKKEPDSATQATIWETIISLPRDLLSKFKSLFADQDDPRNVTRFYGESETIQQANLPSELKPAKDTGIIEKIQQLLGKQSGFLSAPEPNIQGIDDNIKSPADIYQKSYFPTGIQPVVIPDTPTPPPTGGPGVE